MAAGAYNCALVLASLVRRAVPRSVRLWVRHPFKSLGWMRDSFRARAGESASVRILDDWQITCHPAAVGPFTLERDRAELRAELDAFVASCAPGMVLYDIGTHYGLFTLAAMRWSGGTARVVAVDPSAAALEVFDANMRLAHVESHVERVRAAIGDTEGETALLTGGAGAWQMMVEADPARSDATRVPITTLDRLARRTGLTPTHVKIDVEGGEHAVVAGAERLLREARPIVFLELHGSILRRAGRSPTAVLDRLAEYGYGRLEIKGRPVTTADAAALDVARLVCRVL